MISRQEINISNADKCVYYGNIRNQYIWVLQARLIQFNMKLKDIFAQDGKSLIFSVNDDENENPLQWTIEPTDFDIIPDEDGHFVVVGKCVEDGEIIDCFVNIITPERISELVIYQRNDKVVCKEIYEMEGSVIPAVASDCFGVYELYYLKENAEVGINILKEGLNRSKFKTAIAEDLGYILRDENRFAEAIEAFLISEQTTPSSVYIYDELAQLYRELGQKEKELEYKTKFDEGA